LARSNTLWNRNLCTATEKWRSDDDALIGHIHRTLQHMFAGDEIWMSRLQGNDPALTSLEPETGLQSLDEFWYQRIRLDESIEKTLSSLNTLDLHELICYRDFKGNLQSDPRAICLARLFNHQQHHQWTIVCRTEAKASVLSLHNSPENTITANRFWNCRHYF
jgi:uncharacterized damage-inducible protein DinB